MLVPDLTLIFDCDVSVAFKRRQAAGATDVFEKDCQFQHKLRTNYLNLRQRLRDENIVIIDSARPIDEIAQDVEKHIKALL